MLVDAERLCLSPGIGAILDGLPGENPPGQVKPELVQSVLEIATEPCPNLAEAAIQLTELRERVRNVAARHGMLLGAGGAHPTSLWADQLITDGPRYAAIIEELGWIARQEVIFGTHVHIGIDGADKAIYVADGIRRHMPLLLAISANSPLWEGYVTGMMSTRTLIFRHFPRSGIPPHYGTWEIFSRRVELMTRAGAIADYTYLWWDVRPHPNLGTIEIRIFDQQTTIAETIALSALTLCLVHRYSRNFDDRKPLVEVPTELIDDNKIHAALRGLDSELVDFPSDRRAPAAELARELIAELRSDAVALGCEQELSAVTALIEAGTGARRQLEILEGSGSDQLIRFLCGEQGAQAAMLDR